LCAGVNFTQVLIVLHHVLKLFWSSCAPVFDCIVTQ